MNDVLLILLLLERIPIIDICYKIINFKNKMELIESRNYHIERWENISSKYFRCIEGQNGTVEARNFSHIFNGIKYIIFPDHDLQYFKETNSSYQIRALVLELISMNKEWRKYDDKIYGIMSHYIMDKMRNIE